MSSKRPEMKSPQAHQDIMKKIPTPYVSFYMTHTVFRNCFTPEKGISFKEKTVL